jgi:site-specific recombinase XerD
MSHRYRRGDIYWLAYHRHGKLYRESLKTKDLTTAKFLQAQKDKDLSTGTVPTLGALISTLKDEYKAAFEHHKTKRTHAEDLARIKHFIDWAQVVKVSDITEKKLQDYFNYRINTDTKELRKLVPNTVNRIMASLKTFLNFAVRRRYIFENPIRGIKHYRLPHNPPRFLTDDEVKRILKAAARTDLGALVATAIYTGMRKSELFNLEWTDIDFPAGTITVRNKEGFTTKSKRFRIIPIHTALRRILWPLRAKEGRCFDVTNDRRVFRRIVRKAKIQGDIGLHTLRHTFASHLIMNGVDIVTVSKLLGHSSISTTMIYSHLTGDHIKTAVGKLKF